MENALQLKALMPLIHLAGEHVSTLPPAQRADVYEGIALIARDLSPALASTASRACAAIRDAEAHQLTFAAILKGKELE